MNLVSTLQNLMDVLTIRLNTNIPQEECAFIHSIYAVRNLLHQEIADKEVHFEIHLEVEKITYPKIYLESILYNLFSNAIKYRHHHVAALRRHDAHPGAGGDHGAGRHRAVQGAGALQPLRQQGWGGCILVRLTPNQAGFWWGQRCFRTRNATTRRRFMMGLGRRSPRRCSWGSRTGASWRTQCVVRSPRR